MTYSPELAQEICTQVAFGALSMTKLCQQPGMPDLSSVVRWLAEHDDFARKMAEARELRADCYRDKIEDLIDQIAGGKIDPHSARVRMEGLKWLAGIEKPLKYGDRIRQEHVISSKAPDDSAENISRQWLNGILAATTIEAPANVVPLLSKDDSNSEGGQE